MNDHDPCQEVRGELPAMLYGELDEGWRRRVAEHLDVCAECARARAEMAEAVELLGTWELPARELGAGASSRLARRIADLQRRSRWRASWIGAAAAALVFVGLASAAATVRVGEGTLTLTLRAPWLAGTSRESTSGGQAAPEAGERLAALEERLRLIAREESTELALSLGDSERRRAEWSARERESRLELARAVDRALAEDRRLVASWMDAFSAGAARADRFTQDALFELASYVALETER